jgi:hypothetical protein
MCINYLIYNDSRYNFINFGIGNGKTLLCVIIAILWSIHKKENVFIISKFDHLAIRD